MSGRIVSVERPHHCEVFNGEAVAGDIVECEVCGKLWEVTGWREAPNSRGGITVTMVRDPLSRRATRKHRRRSAAKGSITSWAAGGS